jgi:hypothetical protein
MYVICAQLVQLVTALFNSYRKVPSLNPTEAIIFACNLFFTKLYKGGCPLESTESTESPWGVYEESTKSPHGIHCISDSPSRLYMDSTQSPCRLLGTSRKWTMESLWSPHGLHEDSLRSPQRLLRVFVESMETCGGV